MLCYVIFMSCIFRGVAYSAFRDDSK